jgi:starch-binding outer membrane protein, SusD/RagB family
MRISKTHRWTATLGLVVVLLGCSEVLKVEDPDIILDADSPTAALAQRNGVFLRLSRAINGIQGPDGLFMFAGLMADEWRSGDTFVQRNNQDQRVFQPDNTFNPGLYRELNRVRAASELAVGSLRKWWPDSAAAVASVFAARAYVEVLIAEHYCNGTPLSGIVADTIAFGPPLTNDSVLGLAIAHADSALAQAAGGGAPGARWWHFASVVKGRALLDRGQFVAAAAAVDTVPTTFAFKASYSALSDDNQIWALNNNARRYTITNGREGGVGINYVSPRDPRLPHMVGGATAFDNSNITVVRQALYGQHDPVPIVTGIEARLIEAEAQLQTGGDPNIWLGIINTLRTDVTLYPELGTGFAYDTTATSVHEAPPLTALALPAADTARVNRHFSERAFWMFSTGHRLGDMRRLLRQYGRAEAEVYPNGAFIKGGSYSDALQLPVPFDEQNNPTFTSCIDREP